MRPCSIAGLLAIFMATEASSANLSGSFSALTFNVAGLWQVLQTNDVAGDKTQNAGEIGTYFSKYGYDIINMQEDFNYHAYIYETDSHAYRTATSGGAGIGSGLNTVSNYPWIDFARIKWDTCSNDSGFDCFTPKGFTYMRWNPADGVFIDVYNLHADAGTLPGDCAARTANLQQLADYIDTWSIGCAVVVMGDTNSRYTRRADTGIRLLSSQNSLTDVWVSLEWNNVCPSAGDAAILCDNPSTVQNCETVDKVFYRDSDILTLQPTSFLYDGEEFLNTNAKYLGDTLSDHNPILVDFSWSINSTGLRQSNFWGGPYGTWFNDLESIPSSPKTSKLTFRGANRLDAVALQLTDGTTFSHGGTGGTEVTLTLASDEYWISAELCEGKKGGQMRNVYIVATTSKGKTLEAGTSTADCATFAAPDGYQIVGFMGRDGDEMDQLAFIYAPQ